MTTAEQSALQRYYKLLLAAIDYEDGQRIIRVKFDQFDPIAQYYQHQKELVEKNYRAGKLTTLQKKLSDIIALTKMRGDQGFGSYLKEKTGYELTDLPESQGETKTVKSKGPATDPGDFYNKILATVYSPNHKRSLMVTESGADREHATTQVSINLERGGAGVYVADGIDLAINAYWKDDNTVVIETKKNYPPNTKWNLVEGPAEVVKIEYIEN